MKQDMTNNDIACECAPIATNLNKVSAEITDAPATTTEAASTVQSAREEATCPYYNPACERDYANCKQVATTLPPPQL